MFNMSSDKIYLERNGNDKYKETQNHTNALDKT